MRRHTLWRRTLRFRTLRFCKGAILNVLLRFDVSGVRGHSCRPRFDIPERLLLFLSSKVCHYRHPRFWDSRCPRYPRGRTALSSRKVRRLTWLCSEISNWSRRIWLALLSQLWRHGDSLSLRLVATGILCQLLFIFPSVGGVFVGWKRFCCQPTGLNCWHFIV